MQLCILCSLNAYREREREKENSLVKPGFVAKVDQASWCFMWLRRCPQHLCLLWRGTKKSQPLILVKPSLKDILETKTNKDSTLTSRVWDWALDASDSVCGELLKSSSWTSRFGKLDLLLTYKWPDSHLSIPVSGDHTGGHPISYHMKARGSTAGWCWWSQQKRSPELQVACPWLTSHCPPSTNLSIRGSQIGHDGSNGGSSIKSTVPCVFCIGHLRCSNSPKHLHSLYSLSSDPWLKKDTNFSNV